MAFIPAIKQGQNNSGTFENFDSTPESFLAGGTNLTCTLQNKAILDNGLPALNRMLVAYVTGRKSSGGGGDPTTTVTYGGIPLNTLGSGTLTSGQDRIKVETFYMLENDLEVLGDGFFDLIATTDATVGNYGAVLVGSMFLNVSQGVPLATNLAANTSSTFVDLSLSHPINSLTIIGTASNNEVEPHQQTNISKNFGNVAIAGTNASRNSSWWNNETGSISSPFRTFVNAVGQDWITAGGTFQGIPDTREPFAATVSAQSTVTSRFAGGQNRFISTTDASSTVTGVLLVPEAPIAATITGTVTTTIDLLRDRGYAIAITPTSVVTPTLVRTVPVQSLTNAALSVTAQPFERAAVLAVEVASEPTITARFDATRPLSVDTITVQSSVTASFGNTFAEAGESFTPGDYVELYEIDTTVIGGTDVFRFIPHRFETPDVEVQWQGNTYIQFPVVAEGFEDAATGKAPPQPTLRVSNVNKFVLAAVLELGDIIGAKVTRWRTYARFLDNGETPDPSASYAPNIYYVQQKTAHTREMFEFTLSSALDLPGIKLPRRQVLKDQSSDDRNLYAPGVANVRFRGR